MFKVTIYTDGACRGNPGPAGVGAVLLCEDRKKEISKAIGHSTNNRAEIQAVIEALSALKHPEKTEVTLYTDSQLVYGLLQGTYKAKKNRDLVDQMLSLSKELRSLEVVKIKGHNGNPLNELAHTLAQKAIS